jgi:hypothetical protein
METIEELNKIKYRLVYTRIQHRKLIFGFIYFFFYYLAKHPIIL